METGRALIDDAGHLLTTVLANKRSVAGRRTMVIDAGVNLLFTTFGIIWVFTQVKRFQAM